MLSILYNLLEILVVLVPILLSVAFMTVIERKVMGSMQRRIGPNVVGYYALLQPFADALKLVIKEQVIPSQATKSLFFLAPMVTLIFSLLGWGVIPLGPGLALSDFSLGILYSLALSSIGVYGILFAGWSACCLRERPWRPPADLHHECRWFRATARFLWRRFLFHAGMVSARRSDRLHQAVGRQVFDRRDEARRFGRAHPDQRLP